MVSVLFDVGGIDQNGVWCIFMRFKSNYVWAGMENGG